MIEIRAGIKAIFVVQVEIQAGRQDEQHQDLVYRGEPVADFQVVI